MLKGMSPGAIGINVPWPEAAALAAKFGYQAIDVPLGGDVSVEFIKDVLGRNGLKPAGSGMPVDFRRDEDSFKKSLAQLPAIVKKGAAVGCDRFPTWIMPCSDTLPFMENYDIHERRLGECAKILADHGCRLGLEFVGPKTMRNGRAHEFIYNMRWMLKLCRDCGPNTGLLLDCFHWYTSGGTIADLEKLTNNDVVYVHVNDAPKVPREEQIDNARGLPATTGTIDIAGFLKSLKKIGYDGAVVPEPFMAELGRKPAEETAKLVADSLDRAWKLAGL
ncbi:MAG TPA: sugar phosphate isomerase/epimerase [Candidatus Brocadiia bacterium]|nr:sugar phosphate isomerase/epimerase [Candidatus Brocadiia bacterium]